MTILIDQNVAGLQVSVYDIGWVDVFQSTQYLIQEVANVFFTQLLLRVDDAMQITLHEIKDNIDVLCMKQINIKALLFSWS